MVKKQKFNQWIKSHEHLFTQSDNSEIKLFEGKRTPNTLLVEIPVSFNVQRIQRDIGKAVKGKVAKTQANQRFKIQTNRPLQTAPLDYFRWAYEYKQSCKLKLEEIWTKVNQKQIDRQKKVAKRAIGRALSSSPSNAYINFRLAKSSNDAVPEYVEYIDKLND